MKKIIKKVISFRKKSFKINNNFESMNKIEDYIFKTTRNAYAIRRYNS